MGNKIFQARERRQGQRVLPSMTRLCRVRGFFMAGGTHSLLQASKEHDKGGMTMKKLLMFVVCALLALPACAGAEASPTPSVE